ncbi:innexin-5-like [Mya arenaria]|uniref:innexin-5-like n=1 Tax=Mya arenaria TaxID=6604 RepID=UPI0022E31167|nr:innexin-5-like [Mya arenaria]
MPTVSRGLFMSLFRRSAALEDMSDRLNHVWTVCLLLVLAAVTSWRQAYSTTIDCFCPSHFTANQVRAAEGVCWGSYGIKYTEIDDEVVPINIPTIVKVPPIFPNSDSDDSLQDTHTTYYQWVPIILVFQALLFKLPNIVMYVCHTSAGISFDKIAGMSSGFERMNSNDRGLLAKQISRYLIRWCRQCGGIPCRLLTVLWLLVKILFCVNVIVQLCLLNGFLTTTYSSNGNITSYGDVIASNLGENNATLWKESDVFPREVICLFSLRQLQSVQQYSLQCYFPLNAFNENAYQLLWVWLVFVAVVTNLSLLVWMFRTIVPIFRKRYLTNALELCEEINLNEYPSGDIDRFCSVIGEDGVMTLKLLSANSSELLVKDVVCHMWKMQIRDREGLDPASEPVFEKI